MCMDVAMVGGLCEPLVKKNNKTGYNFRLTSRVDEWRAVTSAALRRRKKFTKMAKDPIAHTSRYICSSVFKRLLELDTSQCMHAKQINYLKKKTAIWNRCTCTRVRVKNTKSLPFVNRHNASDRISFNI